MCVGPFKPKAPKMPETPEVAPRPEKTASAPTIGSKRKSAKKPDSSSLGTGSKRKGLFARRRGTGSLRIPLTSSGNLNY